MKKQKFLHLLRTSYKLILLVWLVILGLSTLWEHYRIQINTTTSMPQTAWFTVVGEKKLSVGDYVTARVHDSRAPADRFENVVKQIGGLSGDKITICASKKNNVWSVLTVNGSIYEAHKWLSGYPVNPLSESSIIIPKGCYFVHGQTNPTFDSRYKEFGLVCESQIYGKAYPIF